MSDRFFRFFNKHVAITTLIVDFFLFLKFFVLTMLEYFYCLYSYFWKKLIDFFFFDFLRNRGVYYKIFIRFLNLVFMCLCLYFFFYRGYFNYFYNYVFYSRLESFFWWDLDTYSGYLNMLLCFINIDNLILLFYIVFFQIGLPFLRGLTWDGVFLYVGFN